MGREAPHTDLLARLRYRAAHPLRTTGLLVAMACISMAIGAAAPADSRVRDSHSPQAGSPAQLYGQLQML